MEAIVVECTYVLDTRFNRGDFDRRMEEINRDEAG